MWFKVFCFHTTLCSVNLSNYGLSHVSKSITPQCVFTQGRLFVCFVLFYLYQGDPLRHESDHILDIFGKLLRRRGASAWFHGIWTCSGEVTENSNKFQKTRSWKEKLVENMVTLGPMAQATLFIYESRLFVCFVCRYEIHWIRMLQIAFLVSLESSLGAWFHSVWTCSVEVLEYWMISSLRIKLHRSWKFQRNWNVPLVLLERSWWAAFNEICLVTFGFRMWEILIFK